MLRAVGCVDAGVRLRAVDLAGVAGVDVVTTGPEGPGDDAHRGEGRYSDEEGST